MPRTASLPGMRGRAHRDPSKTAMHAVSHDLRDLLRRRPGLARRGTGGPLHGQPPVSAVTETGGDYQISLTSTRSASSARLAHRPKRPLAFESDRM